ncbi:MAG: hypothetical protein B7733_07405 [Myxococcales bacterium FL481]|nr:MAG: hypothetical protein B7733_07405 [Myxococcales bacterium FL481]
MKTVPPFADRIGLALLFALLGTHVSSCSTAVLPPQGSEETTPSATPSTSAGADTENASDTGPTAGSETSESMTGAEDQSSLESGSDQETGTGDGTGQGSETETETGDSETDATSQTSESGDSVTGDADSVTGGDTGGDPETGDTDLETGISDDSEETSDTGLGTSDTGLETGDADSDSESGDTGLATGDADSDAETGGITGEATGDTPTGETGDGEPYVDCTDPGGPIRNCGFESGTFDSWATDASVLDYDIYLSVADTKDYDPWPELFGTAPSEGDYSARMILYTGPTAATNPSEAWLAQDIEMPPAGGRLRFHWQCGVQPTAGEVVFSVRIEPAGGGSPLASQVVWRDGSSFEARTSPRVLDEVYDLTEFAGQDVRIKFVLSIPTEATGHFELDNVGLDPN